MNYTIRYLTEGTKNDTPIYSIVDPIRELDTLVRYRANMFLGSGMKWEIYVIILQSNACQPQTTIDLMLRTGRFVYRGEDLYSQNFWC